MTELLVWWLRINSWCGDEQFAGVATQILITSNKTVIQIYCFPINWQCKIYFSLTIVGAKIIK